MKSLFHRSRPSNSISTTSATMPTKPSTRPSQEPFLKSDPPLVGHWDSAHTTIGAGVAIFHLASSRVVLCYHTHHNYWFLPKGRRDANEDTGAGAEREGFEEVLANPQPCPPQCQTKKASSLATATAFSLSPSPPANPLLTTHRPPPHLHPSSLNPSGHNWPQSRARHNIFSFGI